MTLKNEIQSQMPNKIRNLLLTEPNLQFRNRQWVTQNMKAFWKMMNSCNCETLRLDGNDHEEILLQIQTTPFIFLSYLDLSGNALVSIQSLCELHAPRLTDLDLGSNKIANISTLRKCSQFSKLKSLMLNTNNFVECGETMIRAPFSNVEKLVLSVGIDSPKFYFFNWILKMESEKLSKVTGRAKLGHQRTNSYYGSKYSRLDKMISQKVNKIRQPQTRYRHYWQ